MAFSSRRDDNYIPAVFGVSSIDLKTPTPIKVNPATGAMLIDSASLYSSLDTRYIKKGGDSVSGNYTFSGHMALGGSGVISTDNILTISETLNDNTQDVFGLNLTLNATAATTHQVVGLQFVVQSNIVSGTIGTLGGMFGGAQTLFGESITTLYGGYFQPIHMGTGTVADLMGVKSVIQNTSSGVVTVGYGVFIGPSINSGGGTITNNYGLFIGDQNVGAANYGIYTNAGQNFFGDTVNIPYGSYFGVNRGENWSSGTHKLIGVSWNGSADETDIYVSGNSRSTPMLSLTGDGKFSVFNHSVAAQQTVTGAKGGNAALASLLTALANYGLIIDSST